MKRINCVHLFSSQVVVQLALALCHYQKKIYSKSTTCTHNEKIVFEKVKEKEVKKQTNKQKNEEKDDAKISNHTDSGEQETHHYILESLSHSALEVGSLQLQHNEKGQENCYTGHSCRAKDSNEQHFTSF